MINCFQTADPFGIIQGNLGNPFDLNVNIISNSITGDGPKFMRAVGDHLEDSGNLVVTDNQRGAVIRVDADTGDRTLITQ